MQQNQFGAIATACWNATPDHYRSVLDEYIIMPNHIHGIVGIGARCVCVGGACPAPTARHTIGNIIGSFKSAVTKHINHIRGTPGAIVWQRNYYERVIRDDDELQRIRQYIRDNPKNWPNDEHRT